MKATVVDRSGVLRNIDESADELGVSARTVATLIARGELRSIKIGRRRLVPRQAIEEFVERQMAAQCDSVFPSEATASR